MFKPTLASLLVAGALPVIASGQTFVDDLTGFSNGISASQAGGDQGQVITAVAGDNITVTIDTTSVDPDPAVSGSYGGGIQTDITNAFVAGDLTSSNPADYNVVFDVTADGFAPANVDVFLQFRNQFNENQLGAQLSLNQNNAVLGGFVTDLGATDGPVSISIPLSEFTGVPADVSGLATSDRIQFQFFTRSLDSGYSADAGNTLVFDNIGVQLVPEPASAALLASGALCLLARRRRSA